MFNVNTAFSQVNGTKEAIEITQKSSARYFQRPDKDYAALIRTGHPFPDQEEECRYGKLNGHLNLMGVVLWKTPGFEIK